MIALDSDGNAKESLMTRYLRIAGVVSLYWSVSITLVFTNKFLLKSEELKLDAPLFVTAFQCLITVLMTIISSRGRLFGVTEMNFDLQTTKARCKTVAPLSVAFVCMVTFNNLFVGWGIFFRILMITMCGRYQIFPSPLSHA